jgi:ribosomal protein L40E
MGKFPEAAARLFHGIFVCRKCKTKKRTDVNKILAKRVSCKKCGGKAFRPIKSKK